MDLSKIFLKDACPTSIGGQAVMGGVMMRGTDRMAIAMRVPDGRIHIKTQPIKAVGRWAKIPIVRGVVSFFSSMVIGMKTLIYSADVLEAYTMDEEGTEAAEEAKPGKLESWLVKHFGENAIWNLMIYCSVLIAIAVSVLAFVLFPTVLVNLLGKVTKSHILLNLAEGLLRILMFIGYILLISKMEDIRVTFQYHGSEHKTIHCFENGLELTPENAQTFYTLHPRCGTFFDVCNGDKSDFVLFARLAELADENFVENRFDTGGCRTFI